jgi:hypothetical protein
MDKLVKALRIAVPAVFAVLLVLYLPKIRVENSLERWVTPSSPEIARYIHLDHPLPEALREHIVRWDDRGEGLVRADRFPFYNLVVMELRR